MAATYCPRVRSGHMVPTLIRDERPRFASGPPSEILNRRIRSGHSIRDGCDGMTGGVTSGYKFAPIPEAVLYDDRLSAQAVRIYGCLMRHGLDPASCFPSQERIGTLLHVSERSVQRPLRELVNTGWVTKVRRFNARGERTSDGYHVHIERADLRGANAQELPLVQRAETSEEGKQLAKESKKPLAPDGAVERAKSILDAVWDAKKARGEPVPGSYVGARKVLEKLIAAGWTDSRLKVAAMKAPTISLAAMEFQLNGRTSATQSREANTIGALAGMIDKDQQKAIGR